jgi:hypothetical protein
MEQLSQQVGQLTARGANPSTIVVQGSSDSSFVGKLVVLGLPGAGVYVYLKYMGYSLADVQWVSSKRFSEAVDVLGKAQEVLDTKIVSFRASAEQALSSFRAIVEQQFRQQQQQIEDQVGAVHGEVQAVRGEVASVDFRVQRLEGKLDDNTEKLRQQIEGNTEKLDAAAARLEYTSQGMNLLCNVVAESFGSSNSESVKRLQTFAATTPSAAQLAYDSSSKFEALEGPPVLIEAGEEEVKGAAANLSTSMPNPIITMGILGSSWAAGMRGSVNLSASFPPESAASKESDNPPERADQP